MILIVCDSFDESGMIVEEIINFKGSEAIIISSNELLSKCYIEYQVNENVLCIRKDEKRISAIWLRKIKNCFSEIGSDGDEVKRQSNSKILNMFHAIFNSNVKGLKLLSPYNGVVLNKIEVLRIALKHGLIVSKSIICNDLDKIYGYPNYISKSIYENFGLRRDGQKFYQYNTTVSELKNLLNDESVLILPSLIQNRIEGSVELRSFHLNGNFYNIATVMDASNHDIRNVPFAKKNFYKYDFSKDVEFRLIKLIAELDLDICVIDGIVNQEGVYHLLEINPSGNFRVLSEVCNFNIEELIANHLIEN